MVHWGPWSLPGRECVPDGEAAWTDVIEAAVNATTNSVASVTMRRRRSPALARAMTHSSNRHVRHNGFRYAACAVRHRQSQPKWDRRGVDWLPDYSGRHRQVQLNQSSSIRPLASRRVKSLDLAAHDTIA